MNRDAMIEAATAAAKQLFSVFIDELESIVHDERKRGRVAEAPVDIPFETPKEPEPQIVVPAVEEEPVQESKEPVAQVVVRALEPAPPQAIPPVRSRGFRYYEVEDDDLLLIEQRSRLKAEGSRWAAQRQRLRQAGADHQIEIAPTDRDLLTRAREMPDCDLWMNRPTFNVPSDLADMDVLGGAFEAVAESVALVRATLEHRADDPSYFGEAVALAAEAQSALRVAVESVSSWVDADQTRIYSWLRKTASERRLYIERHMRMNDPADPVGWRNLIRRVQDVARTFTERFRRRSEHRRLFGKLRHATNQIRQGHNVEEQWSTVLRAIEELIASGLPPSNIELRNLLLPMIDELPMPSFVLNGLRLFLRATDEYLANAAASDDSTEEDEWSEDVYRVRKKLAGRSIVVIGGKGRPHAVEALKDAFGLEDVIWLPRKEFDSVSAFTPYVARPETAVVLLAIKWASHSYADVRESCDRYGKPLVRLPGGYNPNQVAAQIMAQASDRLR